MLKVANQLCLEIGVSGFSEANSGRDFLLTFRVPAGSHEDRSKRCMHFSGIRRQLHSTLRHCDSFGFLLDTIAHSARRAGEGGFT